MDMKLTLQNIKDCSRGVIDVTEENGAYRFHRFTEKQTALYDTSPNWKIRCRCPAGVSLDFITDAKALVLSYSLFYPARSWALFDLYINDRFVDSIELDPAKQKEGTVLYPFSEEFSGEKRVTLYLPHLYDMTVSDIVLTDVTFFKPEERKKKKLLCFGDSITQGMEARSPSNTYPVLLARFLDAEVVNLGVGGYVFDAASLDEAHSYSPDLITVAYGTNDWNGRPSHEALASFAKEFFEKLTFIYPAVPVYAITPTWRSNLNQITKAGTFSSVGDTLRSIAEKHSNIKVIDGLKLVPNQPVYFGDKSLHPNDTGFLHYALNLAKSITPITG